MDPTNARRATTDGDRALDALTLAAKVATVAFGIDAWINHETPRLRGKAIRTRAIGYTAALLAVPLAWRFLPGARGPYPRALDLAVTLPLLADAAGNAFGVYQRVRIDDAVHVANAAILAGVSGSLIAPHVDEPWQAALAGGAIAVAGETLWETHGVCRVAAGPGGHGPHVRGHDGRHHRDVDRCPCRGAVHPGPGAEAQGCTGTPWLARDPGRVSRGFVTDRLEGVAQPGPSWPRRSVWMSVVGVLCTAGMLPRRPAW